MGNTHTLPVPASADLRQLVQVDHPSLLFQAQLGKGKFAKAVRAKYMPRDAGTGRLAPGESSISVEGRVLLKVFLARGEKGEWRRRLAAARDVLATLCATFNLRDQPNILVYQRWEESNRFDAAYATRQFIAHNLYDRLNSRPFPSIDEKLWFIYQLLRAVGQAHAAGVRHGDIKVENVLVTSWGWLFLTDFATFKPTFLAQDSPADFGFYFESGTRSRCCIAPERLVREKDLAALTAARETNNTSATLAAAAGALLEGGGDITGRTASGLPVCDLALRDSMDIFSLGCTIGEIVLDGEPFLDQATLLKYKLGGGGDGGGGGKGGGEIGRAHV